MSRIKFPIKVLKPLKDHLQSEEVKLKKRKQKFETNDPFNDVDRVNDNASIDTDVAEEVGHDRISALKLEVDKTLVRIKKTLTKIKVGKYGLCEGCGKLIDTDRLAIDPTASFCMNCVKKQVKRVK